MEAGFGLREAPAALRSVYFARIWFFWGHFTCGFCSVHLKRCYGSVIEKLGTMGHESISSPHRRAQNPVSPLSASLRRQFQPRDELDGWMALFRRHQFLLIMLAILTFLCTVYLYFAITLGAAESCSGLSGTQKALCHLGQMKTSMPRKGKLKFFWQTGHHEQVPS